MTAGSEQRAKQLYEFGPFRVDAEKELLLRGDESVPLTPKTFQILLVLMRNKKEVVTKDELMKAVWPDTFVEEANLSRNIFLLRKALGETPQDHQYIVTVPGRGYRFAEDVHLVAERDVKIVSASRSRIQVEVKESSRWPWVLATAILGIGVVGAGVLFYIRSRPKLGARDTIVLAEFSNSTGDPVFDGTMRQALAVELEQSPFLSLVSDQRIQQTLRLMGQQTDARLNEQIAHDLCHRTQSSAYMTGSIAKLGSEYVIGLRAVGCTSGDVLADEQETAPGKERILSALDKAAGRLRGRLGESLSTVRKFDTPLEQATTPSLEALQAYTLGRKMQVGRDEFAAAVPFYERAIQLDPNFVMAYAALGATYWNVGESLLGAANASKAFELHDRVTEPERFYIDSTYYHYVTGDLEKARQVYEVSGQTYPRYSGTPLRLWQLEWELGHYDAALGYIRQAIELDSSRAVNYSDLLINLIHLNRLEEAHATAKEMADKGMHPSRLCFDLYRLAVLENDVQEMARQVECASGKGDAEARMVQLEAETAATSGRFREASKLFDHAREIALQWKERESSTSIESDEALNLALAGNVREAERLAASAIEKPTGRTVLFGAALTLAIAGADKRAESLASDLEKSNPDDTLVRFLFIPTIRAQIALDRHDPAKAVDLLQAAVPYEQSPVEWGFLGPNWIRGEAYLMLHNPAEAQKDFLKIIEHRGMTSTSQMSSLAHLQLGKAYALSGDKGKAKAEYQKFLELWKAADPDVPILREAKIEYLKLK